MNPAAWGRRSVGRSCCAPREIAEHPADNWQMPTGSPMAPRRSKPLSVTPKPGHRPLGTRGFIAYGLDARGTGSACWRDVRSIEVITHRPRRGHQPSSATFYWGTSRLRKKCPFPDQPLYDAKDCAVKIALTAAEYFGRRVRHHSAYKVSVQAGGVAGSQVSCQLGGVEAQRQNLLSGFFDKYSHDDSEDLSAQCEVAPGFTAMRRH